MIKNIILLFCFSFSLIGFGSCSKSTDENTQTSNDQTNNEGEEEDNDENAISPLFINSIVSTNIDFITSTDPDSFEMLEYLGQEDKEMPDSRTDVLFDSGTFVFNALFSNDTNVEIWAHSSFGSEKSAQDYALKLTSRLGKLPQFMIEKLSHVVVHQGNAGAFAESEANFFVVYSENIDVRISNNDFEETVFHESVHATLDSENLNNTSWLQAQQNDTTFITEYAEANPNKEDLAETALFVYTISLYPERLSEDIKNWIDKNIPNRKAFISTLFE